MKKAIRLLKILLFAIHWHGDQKRKYTGDPYWFHLVGVARILYTVTRDEISLAIALLHDLFEDTKCTEVQLDRFLSTLYAPHIVKQIIDGVEELTDEYVRLSYPELNRAKRKKLEAERLSTITSRCQTIKYADLIHNTRSIVKHDKEFASVYLQEKKVILTGMRNGNLNLYMRAVISLETSLSTLN